MGDCMSKEKAKTNGEVANDYRPDPTRIRDDMIRGKTVGQPPEMANVMVVNNGGGAGAAPPAIVNSGWVKSPAHAGSPGGLQNGGRKEIVIALYSYQGSEFGDMSFQKGDRMEVLDKT